MGRDYLNHLFTTQNNLSRLTSFQKGYAKTGSLLTCLYIVHIISTYSMANGYNCLALQIFVQLFKG